MHEQIDAIHQAIATYNVTDLQSLEAFHHRYLSKKGVIAQLFEQLPKLPAEEKKSWGEQINNLKERALSKWKTLAQGLATPAEAKHMDEQDPTLPPSPYNIGHLHILTLVEQRLAHIFTRLGFSLATGPEIEDEWHNFTALAFPPHHPARDMQDTFFILGAKDRLLRTHTSSVQIRAMEQKSPPLRCVSLGRVFRNETISARAHCMFHQLEAFYIDQKVSFANLKATLCCFLQEFFAKENMRLRMRPSYFPFTEPGVEVDVACLLCDGKGCTLCKLSGWVEVGGAGLVDPRVLTHCHIDPNQYSGFAFGMGIERLAMLLYQIHDVRLFTENDLRFLRQFGPCV